MTTFKLSIAALHLNMTWPKFNSVQSYLSRMTTMAILTVPVLIKNVSDIFFGWPLRCTLSGLEKDFYRDHLEWAHCNNQSWIDRYGRLNMKQLENGSYWRAKATVVISQSHLYRIEFLITLNENRTLNMFCSLSAIISGEEGKRRKQKRGLWK